MEQIKKLIDKYVKMLPIEGKFLPPTEAEKRASDFLVACAHVTNHRHDLGNTKIEAVSLERAVYGAVVSNADSKKVTEQRIMAEADKDYQTARENLEQVDNDMTYLKTYYEIFNNAHIFYRQMAKGESQ